jgi:hypothetical protein
LLSVSLKLFLHRVKVRKPFRRIYLVATACTQVQVACFNRLKQSPPDIAAQKRLQAGRISGWRTDRPRDEARFGAVDINHVPEALIAAGSWPLNKA